MRWCDAILSGRGFALQAKNLRSDSRSQRLSLGDQVREFQQWTAIADRKARPRFLKVECRCASRSTKRREDRLSLRTSYTIEDKLGVVEIADGKACPAKIF